MLNTHEKINLNKFALWMCPLCMMLNDMLNTHNTYLTKLI